MSQDNKSPNKEAPTQNKIRAIRIKNKGSRSDPRLANAPDFRRLQWKHANEMLLTANIRPEVINNLEKLYFTMDAGYSEDFYDKLNNSTPAPTPVEMAAIAETIQLTLFSHRIQQYGDEEKTPTPTTPASSVEK